MVNSNARATGTDTQNPLSSSADTDKDARYNVRVLDRALLILKALSDGRPRTLMQLSGEVGLNTSTTFRLLSALIYHNYVSRNALSNEYSLGLGCLELARSYLSGSGLRDVAMPHLMALRDETKETVHLAVLDQMEVVYIDKLEGLHAIGLMSSRVGGRNPSYCTGVGKALLAYVEPQLVHAYFERVPMRRFTGTTITNVDALLRHLAETRARGYALDNGEHELEVRCVAVPVFDADGNALAAISISGPNGRIDPLDSNWALIDRTVQAAREISAGLGYNRR